MQSSDWSSDVCSSDLFCHAIAPLRLCQPPPLPIPTFPEPTEAESPLPSSPPASLGTLIHSANTNFTEHLPAPCTILEAGRSLRKRDRNPGSVVGHSLSPRSKSNLPSGLLASRLPFSSGFLFRGFWHRALHCWITPISKPQDRKSTRLNSSHRIASRMPSSA